MMKKSSYSNSTSELVFSRLNYYLTCKQITVYRLHQLTGISMSTLYGIFKSRKNLPSLTNLMCILNALDVRPDIFFAPQISDKYEYVAENIPNNSEYK